MKKSKELNAIRYLQQMNPGSIPVSESMKATNIDVDDFDETNEINAHVGIDEAAVSALYHGRIETQPRPSPSRRMHDTPTKQRFVGRNTPTRMQRTEEPVRYVAPEPAEVVRIEPRPTDSRPTPVDFPPLGTESSSPAQVEQEPVIATPNRTPKKQPTYPVRAPRQPGTPLRSNRQSPNRPTRRPASPVKPAEEITEVPKILQNPRSSQHSVTDDDMMAFFMQ